MLYTSGDENQNSEDKNSKNETNNFSNWLFEHPRLCLLIFAFFSLVFILLLNSFWYWLEQIWDGPKSSLTYPEGFQITIDVLFMCLVAFVQFRIEQKWKKEDDRRQKFEETLRLKEIISERIRSLSFLNQVTVTGYIPVIFERTLTTDDNEEPVETDSDTTIGTSEVSDQELRVYYPKEVQKLQNEKCALLIVISAENFSPIFPECFHVEDLKIQLKSSSESHNYDGTSPPEIYENVFAKYQNGCFIIGIEEKEQTQPPKEKEQAQPSQNDIFKMLISALYYNQKGRSLDSINCCFEMEVKDGSLQAYDVTKHKFLNRALSFKLSIDVELIPTSGFNVFGVFEMRANFSKWLVLDINKKK